MHADDIAAAMRLVRLAGWNQIEADWRFFLEQRPQGCFVAASCAGLQGEPVQEAAIGTVTTVAYGPRLGWISLLLVDPACRKQGIGTRLMQAAVDSLRGHLSRGATVALDATPAGKGLYERLGFREEYGLLRLVRPGRTPANALPAACPDSGPGPDQVGARAGSETRQAITALDRGAVLDCATYGADRTPLLQHLYRRAPEVARLDRRKTAFCLGRHGAHSSQLGPAAAETPEQAIALCRDALATWEGRAVVVDVPAWQEAFLAWLRGEGFAVQRPFTRMSLGAPLPQPAGPARCFAIAGPEFG
jgi:GNAT superfamily N-acetyltransferase